MKVPFLFWPEKKLKNVIKFWVRVYMVCYGLKILLLHCALCRATVVEGDGTADWLSFRANQALPAIQRSKEEDARGSFSVNKKPSWQHVDLSCDIFD